jgi:hypothetical protein
LTNLLLKRRGNRRQPRQFSIPQKTILGVDYSASDRTLPDNVSPFAQNVDFGAKIGDISKVLGYEALITSLGAGKILGLHYWPHSAGAMILAAWDKYIYLLAGESGSVAKTTDADWDAGTHSDTAASSGDLKIGYAGTNYSRAQTVDADFAGTNSDTVVEDDSVKIAATTDGTTRFYLQNAAAGYDPATERGAWDDATQYNAIKLAKTKSGASTSNKPNESTTTTNWDVLAVKAVTDALPANKTISGTLSWCLRIREGNTAGVNAYYHVHAFVTTGDSDTVRGTLLSDYIGSVEWGTTAAGMAVSAQALTSVNAQAGDRVVIEVGYRAVNNESVSLWGQVYYGGTSATDLTDGVTTDYPGWFEFSMDPLQAPYETAGTYTDDVIHNISGIGTTTGVTIAYNKTEPTGGTVTVETATSTDGGSNYGEWTERASGATVVADGTDVSNYRIKWRASFTSNGSVQPSLNDVTIAGDSGLETVGTWISPAYDLGVNPIQANLSWVVTTPASTSVTISACGSNNNSVFGDWSEITNSGDAISLYRYVKVKVEMTGTISATPSVSSILITFMGLYSTTGSTAYQLDISPLGRTNNYLTGNRVRMENYEDWLLCADGDRPFIVYVTEDTEESDTAQSSSAANNVILAAGSSAVDDFYNNTFITITGGTGAGQTRWISDYYGTTKAAVITPNWTTQPDNTSTYTVSSAIKVRNLGVDPPETALSAAADAAAGSPNGVYLYKVTYVNADGFESNAGPASESVTVSSKKINLTSIPVDAAAGNTTAKRRIYRTPAASSVYKYLTEIADNTTTTYQDNTADGALGSLMLDNLNIPPDCTIAYPFNGYVFYAAGYDVWFSKVGAPDHVPNVTADIQSIPLPAYVLDIKSNPMALLFMGENFVASNTSNTGFIFDSDVDVDTTTMKIISGRGSVSYEASDVCVGIQDKEYILFASNHGLKGIVPGWQEQSLDTKPVSWAFQPYFENSINREFSAGIFHGVLGYYLYSMQYQDPDTGEVSYLTFAVDHRGEALRVYGPWTFGMSCYTTDGTYLYGGDPENGIIYRLFTGHSFAGDNIEMICDLPTLAPGGEGAVHDFRDFMAVFSADSDTTATQIIPKVGDKERPVSIGALTSKFEGNVRPGHNTIRSRYYTIGKQGYSLSHRIYDNSTNHVQVKEVVTRGIIEDMDI